MKLSRLFQRRALLIGTGLALGAGTLKAQEPAPHVTVMLEDFPPYSFADAQGRASGYSVELARELLARAKLEASYEFTSWPRVMHRARSEPNVLVPAIVRLAEREQQFYWLGQISTRRGMLFRLKSRPDVQLHSLSDAKAYRIGVIKDDVSERELLALGLQLGEQLDRCADYPGLLRRFFAGHDQLLALNQALAPDILRRHGFDPAKIEPVIKFSDSRPSMALSLATDEALKQRIQKAWDGMRRDGSAATISNRYPALNSD